MAEIIEKKESNSGRTVGIIEKSDGKFIGTVTYNDNAGDIDEDTREFATLEDAQGWLELTLMFIMGVHADI